MKMGMRFLSGKINLPVVFLREGKSVIAYAPALDLSTSGKNVVQARKRFIEIVRIFIKDLAENDTLEPVLLNLGWTKSMTQKERTWSPPQQILSQEEMRIPVNV